MLLAILVVLHFSAAAALVFGMDRLALIPWRKAHDAHWTERTRLLWPARTMNGFLLFAIPVSLAAVQLSLFPKMPFANIYAALAGFAGVILGMWPMGKAVFPRLSFAAWTRNLAAAFLIRFMILGVFIAAGFCMPARLNLTAMVLTGSVVALALWLIWGGMIVLLRVSGLLVPAPERLARVVSEVAAHMELPLPRAWLLRGLSANAIAYPVIHTLVVTEWTMELFSDEELAAICAHEFAHLNEPPRVVVGLILGSFVLLPGIFMKPAIETWGLPGYLGILAAIIVLSKLAVRFRRRMETRADSVAAVHEGPSLGTYALALERLYEINQIPAVIRGNRTHPNLYDRMLASGITPTYPRPAPPKRFTWVFGLALLMFLVSLFCAGYTSGLRE